MGLRRTEIDEMDENTSGSEEDRGAQIAIHWRSVAWHTGIVGLRVTVLGLLGKDGG